jgi:dihydroxy-acid dehydratase
MTGNLVPEGAILKQSGVRGDLMRHRGPARVFDSYHDFEQLMHRGHADFSADEVLVIRNEGPRGGPGMQEILIPPALYRQGLEEMVIITDGRTSGTSRGRLIVHASPEAAAGGPLCLIRNGDVISLDIGAAAIHAELTEKEWRSRKAEWSPPAARPQKDWLGLYQRLAASAVDGAGLDW